MNNTPFPPEIEELILKRQVEAGNKADITVFYDDPWTSGYCGGFDWSSSPEKSYFWCEILENRNYKQFYDKYPQTQYKGHIAGYPKEIVDLALERMTDIQSETKLESLEEFGFNAAFSWKETPEGGSFWIDIRDGKFETFYKLYPGTQTLTNNEESRSKNEQISSIDGEQGIQGSSYYRASNQARKRQLAADIEETSFKIESLEINLQNAKSASKLNSKRILEILDEIEGHQKGLKALQELQEELFS